VLGVWGVTVDLTGGDHTQHVRGPASQLHLLVDAQALVDLHEAASWQDLHREARVLFHMPNGFCRIAHQVQLGTQFPVFSKQHHCGREEGPGQHGLRVGHF